MKRITFLTGYYGSGKTEIALNLGIQKHVNVIVDLDIINPYFRSREQFELLTHHGITVISNQLKDGIHADLPYIGGEVFQPFLNPSLTAIYDLGGNDLGAKLLAQFSDYLTKEPIDLLLVINPNRLETSSIEQIRQLIEKIETSGHHPVTGLINNSNLLKETTIDTILEGDQFLKEVSEAIHLPILFTMVEDRFYPLSQPLSGEVIRFKRYFDKKWY